MRADFGSEPASAWECSGCREVVAVPTGAIPLALIVAVTGRPSERVVSVDRTVVHRCAAGPAPTA
jgi:hypothetical protein